MIVISGKKQANRPYRSPLRPLPRAMAIVMDRKTSQATKSSSHASAAVAPLAPAVCRVGEIPRENGFSRQIWWKRQRESLWLKRPRDISYVWLSREATMPLYMDIHK